MEGEYLFANGYFNQYQSVGNNYVLKDYVDEVFIVVTVPKNYFQNINNRNNIDLIIQLIEKRNKLILTFNPENSESQYLELFDGYDLNPRDYNIAMLVLTSLNLITFIIYMIYKLSR